MQATVHFLAGDDNAVLQHYLQKGYRDDIVLEIDNLFYEVYFFLDGNMDEEIIKNSFFAYPGLIVLENLEYNIIYAALNELIDLNYFDYFTGSPQIPVNNRFIDRWFSYIGPQYKTEGIKSYKLR